MITRLILNYHDRNVTISPDDRPSLVRTGKDREGQSRQDKDRGTTERRTPEMTRQTGDIQPRGSNGS